MPDEQFATSSVPVPVVVLAGWAIPGAGYFLLGQRKRALAVGVTILVLYFLGLLVGGIRELEVPGYSAEGKMVRVASHIERRGGGSVLVTHEGDDVEDGPWVLTSHPLDEIRAKPWSIPQIITGPVDLLCSWWSLAESDSSATGHANATRSHSRTNEIGVLYTAVAGMLNLLAIIDAAHRAGQGQGAEAQ
jgi:hypothetical protein